MLLPSGDHFGPELLPAKLVSCFCVLPSVARSQICDLLSLEPRSYSVTSTAHQLPSGAIDGGPTRLTRHRSSGVIPRFSPATSGAQRKSAVQNRSDRMRTSSEG